MSIIAGVLILIIVAVLIPVGIGIFNTANQSGWSTTQIVIFGLFAVFVLIGLLVAVLAFLMKSVKSM